MNQHTYHPNVVQRSIQRAAALRPISWAASYVAPHLDRPIYRLTGGRQTAVTLLTGLPIIMLTTTGAKSGQPRTIPLVAIPNDDGLVIIASNWGGKSHPAWYHNLKANPDCIAAVNGRAQPYTAHELSGEAKTAAYRKAATLYAGYNAYKTRAAGREIPVLQLVSREP
ncbi:MAG: nitroreductase family deazaflavin-dependent oxidoreductase [Chloroflexi bacterium]|nr:nitroreductase family deazaflavin-dependent oxidoreductase [Chloroflexota bacterium]